MKQEQKKSLQYKPYLYGFAATSFATSIGLGIANVAWIAVVKVPNPALVTAFWTSLGVSAASGAGSGVDY